MTSTLPLIGLRPTKIGEVVLDQTSIHRLKGRTIYKTATGYPCLVKGLKLHHFLFGKPPKGLMWDHINRNKLDCRRANLRLVTAAENAFNKGTRSPGQSGLRGVYKWKQYWIAKAVKNGHQYMTYHKTKEEAAEAVIRLRQELSA